MKTFLTFLVLCFLQTMPCTGQVLFHEDFEVPDSVFSSGTGYWSQNYRIQAGGMACDSATILTPGGSAILTTIAFSTVGHNSIFLSFNHIAKNEFFDPCMIEVSVDSGISWNPLCFQYVSVGPFVDYGCKFNESSYATWLPGVQALPDNSWWKHEVFDLTGTLFNTPNAMIRFIYQDSNGNGMGFNGKGWYLDDLLVTDNPGYGFVTGKLFFDANSNSIQDTGEPGIPFSPVIDSISGQSVVTGSDGYYVHSYFDTINTNYNVLGPDFPNFTKSPSGYQGSITYSTQVDSLRNFAYQPSQIVSDIGTVLITTTPVRSGLGMYYSIHCFNSGTIVSNPTVVLYPDPLLTYIYSAFTPSLITADSIIWTLPSFLPFQSQTFLVNMSVASGLPIGTPINSYARIYPFAGDADTLNNKSLCPAFITGSLDPNDINVSRDTIFASELSGRPELDYLIRFQNTGNDTAFHVQILNPLPEELDFGTFRFIGSSHPVSVSYQSGINVLVFDFNPIFLPDSNVNEPESHGYVWYRISPHPNLIAGDSIRNHADIYFDFNAPVTTNTAITEIVLPTGLTPTEGTASLELKLYPNPTSGITTVDLYGWMHEKLQVNVLDLMGRQVARPFEGEITSERLQITCDISSLPSGIYILSLQTENRKNQVRLLKY